MSHSKSYKDFLIALEVPSSQIPYNFNIHENMNVTKNETNITFSHFYIQSNFSRLDVVEFGKIKLFEEHFGHGYSICQKPPSETNILKCQIQTNLNNQGKIQNETTIMKEEFLKVEYKKYINTHCLFVMNLKETLLGPDRLWRLSE